ncbi:MAG: hypothetical protein U9P81_07400 [Euryarchaeota archaeon]|nr:hypothetical protein [Euryarchaeota archaeon]
MAARDLLLDRLPFILAKSGATALVNDSITLALGISMGMARIVFEFTAVAIDEVLPSLE